MPQTTITEALQSLKTISKRIQSKREGIITYAVTPAEKRDPLRDEEGGSRGWIARERQAVKDLTSRFVRIRTAILRSNLETQLTLHGKSQSVADWLVWRREHQTAEGHFLKKLNEVIHRGRRDFSYNENKDAEIIVQLDEAELQEDSEGFVEVSGDLDGKLSLLNATTFIDVD